MRLDLTDILASGLLGDTEGMSVSFHIAAKMFTWYMEEYHPSTKFRYDSSYSIIDVYTRDDDDATKLFRKFRPQLKWQSYFKVMEPEYRAAYNYFQNRTSRHGLACLFESGPCCYIGFEALEDAMIYKLAKSSD